MASPTEVSQANLTDEELMQNVRYQTDELAQARARMVAEKSPEAAMAFCRAYEARRKAQSKLPKLHVV
jgi:hypothetical protein